MHWACYTGSSLVRIPDPRAGNPHFTEVLKAVEQHKVTIIAPLPVEAAKKFEDSTGSIIFELN